MHILNAVQLLSFLFELPQTASNGPMNFFETHWHTPTSRYFAAWNRPIAPGFQGNQPYYPQARLDYDNTLCPCRVDEEIFQSNRPTYQYILWNRVCWNDATDKTISIEDLGRQFPNRLYPPWLDCRLSCPRIHAYSNRADASDSRESNESNDIERRRTERCSIP